jgi:hypothetical protein
MLYNKKVYNSWNSNKVPVSHPIGVNKSTLISSATPDCAFGQLQKTSTTLHVEQNELVKK